MQKFINDFFKIRERKSNLKTETLGGITIFLTMAYIIFVEPAVLQNAGMDFGAVMTATNNAFLQSTTSNQQSAIGNAFLQSATSNQQPAIDNAFLQSATSNQQPATSNQQCFISLLLSHLFYLKTHTDQKV